jgi:hypothetical protein
VSWPRARVAIRRRLFSSRPGVPLARTRCGARELGRGALHGVRPTESRSNRPVCRTTK